MQFLMFVCNDTTPVEPNPTPGMDIEDWVETYNKSGVRLMGDRVQPASAATTIRVRNDEVLVTDGPFIESKEAIAGFDVLECRDLAEAIEVATAHPMARDGVIEIRPFWVYD